MRSVCSSAAERQKQSMNSASLLSRGSVSHFNSALKSCAESEDWRRALVLFRELLQCGVKSNDLTFSLLLKSCASELLSSCSSRSSMQEVNQVHPHLLKSGVDRFVYVSTALLDLYMKLRCRTWARRVFDDMPMRDVISWNALICGYSRSGYDYEAMELFVRMLREGFAPRPTTLVSLLPSCARLELASQGRSVHCLGIKNGLDLDPHVRNVLISMYGKCGELYSARLLFEGMDEKSIVSWNTMISSYGQHSFYGEALLTFKRMLEQGIDINSVTIVSLLSAHADVESAHCYALKAGFLSDGPVVTSLICAYVKLSDMISAKTLYESLPEKNLVSSTAIISGYANKGKVDDVVKIFVEMQKLDMKLDAVALLSILHGVANVSTEIGLGLAFHCYGLKLGLCPDCLVTNGLITMYSKFNDLESAYLLFYEMREKPLVSWNSILSGCIQCGASDDAIKLFHQMRIHGQNPDSVTIASLLSGCSQLTNLELGREIHCYTLRNYLHLEEFVETALIDMYIKCGRIQEAERIFQAIESCCLATWNTMISGFGLYGFERKALLCYSEMRELGLQPDKITFLGVLAACTHGGLVDEGRRYYVIMTKELGMVPTLQHYACMVGLLGRAGLFEEAMDFIKNMSLEPDSAVWGALLNACWIHQDLKLGESLAKKLLFLDQESGGFYVLMSNLYADKGRWDDVARIREMMRDIGGDGCYGASQIQAFVSL
ncbi:pentatricopeptide repeat-containing protein At2g04860 [Punica granatum]|uniref:Pentatricopeptide repeat-containing protein At2g04860 n=1 Tax=Punica granatum TaxID=22663 RepID=A0A6P8EKG6_PUNGR|nr:pentatricopeptide repeat-containing protein At2g04860 [Punica granatum]